MTILSHALAKLGTDSLAATTPISGIFAPQGTKHTYDFTTSERSKRMSEECDFPYSFSDRQTAEVKAGNIVHASCEFAPC